MKYLKYFGISLVIFFLWLFLVVTSRLSAYEYVSFLASSVANSCTFYLPIACGYFEWDKKLQIASYISYALIMCIVTYTAASLLKYKKSKLIKRMAIFLYVCSFPTYTLWGVASVCGGFGPCATGYYIGVIVPVIMSADLYTLPSIVLAVSTVWVYVRASKISL